MTVMDKTPVSTEFVKDVLRRLEDHHARLPINGMTEEDVLSRFVVALEQLGPKHLESFNQKSHGAKTEAITWQILQQLGGRVLRYEIPGRGGPDFVVNVVGTNILVESTSIQDQTLLSKTGLDLTRNLAYQGLGSSVSAFRNSIKGKASQIAKTAFCGPRLVVISYCGSSVLYDPSQMSRDIVVESDNVSLSICGGIDSARQTTNLDASAWYQLIESAPGFESARKSISAVILIELRNNHVWLAGSVNPHALYPLDPNCLPEIPWTKVVNDPESEGVFILQTEWVDQRHKVHLTDHEVCELWFDADAPQRNLLDYHIETTRNTLQ